MTEKPKMRPFPGLSTETKQAMAMDYLNNQRVVHLTISRIYHQNKIKKIESELETLLKKDVDNVDY